MTHHRLKLEVPYFQAKADGVKPWEIRSTEDRSFKIGDTVTFHEVAHLTSSPPTIPNRIVAPTGRSLGPFTITYVLDGPTAQILWGTCIFTHTSEVA